MNLIIKNVIKKFIYYLDLILPKRTNTILYDSFPDFSDSTFVVFNRIAHTLSSNYKHVWLITEPTNIKFYKNKINLNNLNKNKIIFVKKNSLRGVVYYLFTKLVFTNIGVISGIKIPKKHIVINLWHGMPIKAVGKNLSKNYLIKNSEEKQLKSFSYILSTSSFYTKILKTSFEIDESKVLEFGIPRNDLLSKNTTSNPVKHVLWMPTYSENSHSNLFFNFLKEEEIIELNKLLVKNDMYLAIKLHILEKNFDYDFDLSNIELIDNNYFLKNGIEIYDYINNYDCLITDYSSVSIDFLITEKPIYLVSKNYVDYFQSRGYSWPGFKGIYEDFCISNFDEFCKIFDNLSNKQFNKVEKEFISEKENATEKLIDFVINKGYLHE